MWPPLVLLFLLLPAAHGAPHPAVDLQESFPSVLEGPFSCWMGWGWTPVSSRGQTRTSPDPPAASF
ncbi:hypothetical protein U0070_001027, partial [Myodes glareolus]